MRPAIKDFFLQILYFELAPATTRIRSIVIYDDTALQQTF